MLKVITLIIVGIFIYFWNKKITFYKNRNGKEKVVGEFLKYKSVTEKVLRNEYHTSIYPFVKINQGTENVGIFRLNFKNKLRKSFRKGEKIELFWCNNQLLYWNAYEIGILKFIPKKWLF
ncbi:MAG: hypothetical protein AB8B78_07300 [Polaribacter sp.]